MTSPKIAPYGSWKSPITSSMMASETITLRQAALDGKNIYWSEMRQTEGGHYVIVRRTPDGRTTDVTPPSFNARTRVHEYGGGDFTVANGAVYFSNFADQRLYRQTPGDQPQPLTPEAEFRYADGILDFRRGQIVCVREDHTFRDHEPANTIVSIDLEQGGNGRVLVSGNDFYSSPRLSPDGSRLAWLTWNHPSMPWDSAELWIGEIEADGSLGQVTRITGGADESIFQPQWSPDGVLHFVSDRTGWWNLYRWRGGRVEPLTQMEAEFGRPQWRFGLSTYAFESANCIICTYVKQGIWNLASLNTDTGQLDPIETPYTEMGSLCAGPGRALFFAGSPTQGEAVVHLDLATRQTRVLRRGSEVTIDEGYISLPQTIEFPTEHGLTAHAFFYPPKNRDYVGPPGERPPLVVMSHGGPTGTARSILDLEIQYWCSRGIAVLDVNYGGSTGYGRAYRQRLEGQWGIVDVADCVNGARYLVKRGEVDGNRLIIRGGSAGGYTTLCALTFHDVFKAGASFCGISDLEAMTKETHKFESHYLEGLIGPYPERRDLYQERSPIHFAGRLSRPVIFFQGLEDKVVLPNQSELMVEALRAKGLPVAYVAFEGEQHGFRRAENIKYMLDAELYFYSRILGFALADPVAPVTISNL